MPRPEFQPLTVAEVRRETDEAVSVAFAVPEGLKEAYRFTQGQYLTLRAKVDGEELRRPYSVCVAPEDDELRICVKKLHAGRFSTYVNDVLRVGDRMDVLPPMGRFYAPPAPDVARHYVGFAGGSGITPVLSNLRAVLTREPHSTFTLFYGNRTGRSIIFRDQLGDLKDTHLDRLRVFHVLSDERPEVELFGGMMDEAKVCDLASRLIDVKSVDWFFVCGPGPMMDAAKIALEGLGAPPERIKIESFGNRPFASALKPLEASPGAAERMAVVDVKFRGLTSRIKVPFEGEAILDAAHRANIDVPFACKGGVCCTCRARLVEGKVEMDVVYGLEPDEIAVGYILTCQSHPLTDRLLVDYDG